MPPKVKCLHTAVRGEVFFFSFIVCNSSHGTRAHVMRPMVCVNFPICDVVSSKSYGYVCFQKNYKEDEGEEEKRHHDSF